MTTISSIGDTVSLSNYLTTLPKMDSPESNSALNEADSYEPGVSTTSTAISNGNGIQFSSISGAYSPTATITSDPAPEPPSENSDGDLIDDITGTKGG